mgnify:CR=1 FL=1
METENHMSRTIAEAMEWLRKMGIDAKPALPSHKMYEFEYDNVMMLISTDLPNDQIQISCPFYLVAENEVSNKETFEIVKDIVPHIGYLHRCFDKHAESMNYGKSIPFTDRLDYLASMNNSHSFVMGVERMLGIDDKIPKRFSRFLFASSTNNICNFL